MFIKKDAACTVVADTRPVAFAIVMSFDSSSMYVSGTPQCRKPFLAWSGVMADNDAM